MLHFLNEELNDLYEIQLQGKIESEDTNDSEQTSRGVNLNEKRKSSKNFIDDQKPQIVELGDTKSYQLDNIELYPDRLSQLRHQIKSQLRK